MNSGKLKRSIPDARPNAGFISGCEENATGSPANIVDGLFEIARALNNCAREIRNLGNGDACTPMGAIEAFGEHIGKIVAAGMTEIAEAIEGDD